MRKTSERLVDGAASWLRRGLGLALTLLLLTSGSVALEARSQGSTAFPGQVQGQGQGQAPVFSSATPDKGEQFRELRHALERLPLAAALAAVLALRPRRKGTPKRQPAVIQTQIILALIGGLVMLVVGSSLARAFGIVGAAGLVRYRARVDDPKDAGVMLSTLAVGLASGVGMWMLAVFGTAFILLVLWTVESFEPEAKRKFTLNIKAKNPEAFKPKVEEYLKRQKVEFELRAQTPEELTFEFSLPIDQSTDALSERIIAMEPSNETEVEIKEVKAKK